MKYIPRNRYIEKVRPYFGKGIIKVFVGQRRVGKSYLMLQVIDELRALNPAINIIHIDKEKYEFDGIQTYADLVVYVKEKEEKGENALFVDEIQDIDGFEKALRSLQNEVNFDIYITGSNANLLSGELATFLSGRYVEIPIYSLSYIEFLTFHDKEAGAESFESFLQFGGLPNLIHLPLEEAIIFDYLKNIYTSILYKDVVKRYNIRNVAFLENLVNYLADNVGSLVSAKKIADFLKSQQINISVNSVLDYLSYLNNTYFVQKVKRQDIQGKKIFEIGEKYYFEDTGLRNAIVGYRQNDIQKLLENVVYNHLKICGFEVLTGHTGDKEIDFIAKRRNERIYVQVTYLIESQKTHDREFGNLLNINDNFPKYVLSTDAPNSSNTFKGIKHQSIISFLTTDL